MTEQELIHAYAHGTTELHRIKIVMQSERFIVFRVPGHTDWSGVGMRDYYASHTVLARKGVWCLAHEAEHTEWYGRVSKKTLKEALESAEKRGKTVRATYGDLYTGATA